MVRSKKHVQVQKKVPRSKKHASLLQTSSKRGYTPNPLVCLTPGQTHLAIHVPSFTSQSSEILLRCLFNIVTWRGKKYGCSGRTNRIQWCETASWKFQATFSGLHMASHVLCDLKIWLQMHGIPVQVARGVHGISRVEAGWEVWGAGSKKMFWDGLIPSHPSSWGAGLVLSRAGRAWRWGGIGPKFWPGQMFESDAITCLIGVTLQMPCIIFTVPHTISTTSVEKGFDLDVKPMNLVHAHPET